MSIGRNRGGGLPLCLVLNGFSTNFNTNSFVLQVALGPSQSLPSSTSLVTRSVPLPGRVFGLVRLLSVPYHRILSPGYLPFGLFAKENKTAAYVFIMSRTIPYILR